jgi:hypothetical protein
MSLTPRHEGNFDDELFDFVRRHEAVVRRIYTDSRGIPTLGIGFALIIFDNAAGAWEFRGGSRDALLNELRAAGVIAAHQEFTADDDVRLNAVLDILNNGTLTDDQKQLKALEWIPADSPGEENGEST